MSTDIVIVAAGRTAVGSFNGAFGAVPAHELGAAVIKEVMARAKVEGDDVDEVILGQVLTAAQGQNPARQAAMAAGVPKEKTAWSLNQVCGSGLRSVALGMQQIANGDASIIVAGGQESMSLSPHASYLRGGVKMGDTKLVDTMMKDGLIDAFQGYPMGNTAENNRREMADLTRGPGPVRAELAEQGRGGAEGGPLQGRDRALHRQGPQGRRDRRRGRVHPQERRDGELLQAEAGLLQGGHGDRRQRLPASTTAPPPWC